MIRVLGESFEPARSDAFRPRDGHLTDHLLHLVVPPAIRHCDELFCGAGLLNRRVKSAASHVGKPDITAAAVAEVAHLSHMRQSAPDR